MDTPAVPPVFRRASAWGRIRVSLSRSASDVCGDDGAGQHGKNKRELVSNHKNRKQFRKGDEPQADGHGERF